MKLPSVDDLLNRKNWTGYSLKELVEFGRVTPNQGAEDCIVAEQKKQLDAGFVLPFDKVGEYIKIWEQLEYEVLDALVAIEEASE